ncbi:MAG: CAP domain-containing protein [Aristaeellaceae bacterium]
MQEEKLLNLINRDRAANGLPALTADPALSRIARIKSEDMRDNGYFAHESPIYGKARQMLERFGYAFQNCGENIAHHATVEKAQAAFMTSDGHRRNILSAAWKKVGVGICLDRNGFVYATQLFVR